LSFQEEAVAGDQERDKKRMRTEHLEEVERVPVDDDVTRQVIRQRHMEEVEAMHAEHLRVRVDPVACAGAYAVLQKTKVRRDADSEEREFQAALEASLVDSNGGKEGADTGAEQGGRMQGSTSLSRAEETGVRDESGQVGDDAEADEDLLQAGLENSLRDTADAEEALLAAGLEASLVDNLAGEVRGAEGGEASNANLDVLLPQRRVRDACRKKMEVQDSAKVEAQDSGEVKVIIDAIYCNK
jgi:hypothetical protein